MSKSKRRQNVASDEEKLESYLASCDRCGTANASQLSGGFMTLALVLVVPAVVV